MHTDASQSPTGFSDLVPGTILTPLRVTVSAEANRRYHDAAGVTHRLLDGGALYPPIAANLTIMLLQQTCSEAVLHTRQRLRCHRRAEVGTPLVVTGSVADRFEKRNRVYLEIAATISDEADDAIWTSLATFTPTAST